MSREHVGVAELGDLVADGEEPAARRLRLLGHVTAALAGAERLEAGAEEVVEPDRPLGGGSAARDLAQEHAARRGARRKLLERLAVDLLVRHQDVDALHRHCEQFAVLDFDRRCAEDVHQHFALARDRHHVAFL